MKVIKRIRGQKLPENTVYVGRPSQWGNPFKLQDGYTAKEATLLYEKFLNEYSDDKIDYPYRKNKHLLRVDKLKGKNLACWCGEWKVGEPEIDCHAVVLLKMAMAS